MMNGNAKNVSKKPILDITITCVAGDWKAALPHYRRAIKKWCTAACEGKKEVAVVLADDTFIHELNHTYRGKNKPTNVLSFAGTGDNLGDIILGFETIMNEAQHQNKSIEQHTAHLVVHGCLHLQGHDHETIRDAKLMEAKEVEILAALDLPNPYMEQ